MEPTEAVSVLEVAFRELIRVVWGDEWKMKSKADVTKLEQKHREESAKRRGAVVSSDLLDYTEFTQLGKLLLDNWADFDEALGKRKYIEVYIDRLNGLRNAPMHSRVLLPFERDLLSGMVGEIVNLVTIYRSQRSPDAEYYPVIDSVDDSFGNRSLRIGIMASGLRLRVGETVSFNCSATDPQARELIWDAAVMQGSSQREIASDARGAVVTVTWLVDQTDVGEKVSVLIRVRSTGKYHRASGWDDSRLLIYSVLPPADDI